MEHLADTTVGDLRQTLDSVAEKTPVLRLVAAIAYKNGITQSELAEWFDVERKTIYNWLTRLDGQDLDEAIQDDHRPGRPRKLSNDQLDELNETLQNPPTEVGFDTPAWTTELLQEFIHNKFEIEYSRSSCRRLMKEAGLTHQTNRKAIAEADPDERETFEQELQNLGHIWMPS